jgi:outer membrane biosynthesis protein TonB
VSARAAAVGMIVAMAATCAAAEEPFHARDPAQWGQAMKTVDPRYPPQALAAGRTGYVDVRGRVSPLGILQDIEYSPDSPESNVFIDPIRRVIRSWTFRPPLGRDCQPSEARIANRISFEMPEGKPQVRTSLLRNEAVRLEEFMPLERDDPVYPPSMRRAGAEAVVYTRLRVDPAGNVTSVEPRAYPAGGATREFEHEVIRALSQWKFPQPPAGHPSLLVCFDVWFRLTD